MKEECKTIFPAYLQFKDELGRYILQQVKSKEVAEDLTSQLSLKMYGVCEKLQEVSNMRAWLYRVASNVVNDYFREEKNKQKPLNEIEAVNDESDDFISITVENCLIELLERLPEKYKEAVRLSDLEGVSQKEIAIRLNISYSAAKMRVQRGREHLKSMFYDCCSDVVKC